jgi:glycosyltransferase involved in cell wall biosynthesis
MAMISVVIPALDDAVMLRQVLAALAAGTRRPDEVVVVDNGSVDDTAAVARAAGARVVPEPVRGILPATATGFDAAEGDVLARLDADSVPPADWLARVEVAFAHDPALAAVTGPGEFYGGRRLTHTLARRLYVGGYFWFMTWMLGHPPLFGSNLAIRAATWRLVRDEVHRSDPRVHDDLDIAFHLHPGMRVRYDPTLVVGVSARPFASIGGFLRRLAMAFGTLGLHWRDEKPWQRWRRWRAWERDNLTRTGPVPEAPELVVEDPDAEYGWGHEAAG